MRTPKGPQRSKHLSLYLQFKSIGLSKQQGRKPSTLRQALKHNRRVGQEAWGNRSNIDATRTHLNVRLFGASDIEDVVKRAADKLKQAAGKTLRRDHVQAVELVTSLPDEVVDHSGYFDSFLSWAIDEFGEENLISVDVHMDESARHCHLLVLPLTNGVYTGTKTVTGQRFTALKATFAKRVGEPYDLRFATRVTRENNQEAVDLTMRTLREKDDPVLRSRVRSLVERAIRSDPRPFLMQLGMNIPTGPKKKMRTMAEIFTSPGKGPSREV